MLVDKAGASDDIADVMSRLLAEQGAIVVRADLVGTVSGWSASASRLLGVEPAAAIGRPIHGIAALGLGPSDVERLLQAVQNGSWVGKTKLAGRHGDRIPCRVSAVTRSLPDGGSEVVIVAMPTELDGPAADAQFLHALAKRDSDTGLVCDRDLVILYAGPAVERVLGYRPSEMLGKSARAFAHPDDLRTARVECEAALVEPGGEARIEVRVRHRDDSWRWVRVTLTNLLDDEAIRGVVLNIRDITRRREADIARANSDQLHKTILQTAQEGVWAVGLDGVTLFANAKMAELMGAAHEAMLGRTVWEFLDRAALGVVRHPLPFHERTDGERYELEVTNGSSERRWLLVTGSPLYDGNGQHIANLAMYSDITDRKHLEQELAQLSLYDSLTALPNRALLLDRLERLQRDSERTGENIAVLYCDIDHFKEVNRVRGHGVGDEVLAALGRRLTQLVRDDDTVARFDSDEFVIVCPSTDNRRARELADQICAAVQAPFEVAGDRVYVSVSVGLAATPRTAHGDLLSAAANARYQAQELGRSRVEVHDSTTRTPVEDRLHLLVDLQEALDAERLEMHYQPIVNLSDSTPVAAEALMRWNHPVQGAIGPSEFIPAAENGGLAPRLGAWSLRRACQDAVSYSGPDDDWHLAVNMSTLQLADDRVLGTVRQALQESGLSAHRLLLEVTETAVVSDSTHAISILRAIRELGVRIAIDDFGTGYSSLSYLRQFPVDMIKIDKSFIAGMTSDSDDMAIVASLVSLAAAVGVQAVAEGVETQEQKDALRRLGCPLAQGFLWSPAVPVADLAKTMAKISRGGTESRGMQRLGYEERRKALRFPAADEAVVARIIALHQSGASLTTIAAALNADNLTTARGLRWHRSSVARIIADRQFPGMGATSSM